ncbi:7-carboxy-7-deazaguanine synthase QueE [Nitratifractor sp.]
MLLSEMDREFEALGYLPHVVITGGEPLIYATDAIFNSVIEGLIRRGITVTFETNGTIAPDFERYPFYARCVYALSIKLSNSGEPYERRIVPGTLRSIAENARESFLKFTLDRQIVESGAAEQEIAQIRVMLPEAEVFCMPVGESRAALERNDRAVYDFCLRHGYRYGDRLHIRIFDTTVGV